MSLTNNTNELTNINSKISAIKNEYISQTNLISQIKEVLQEKASGELPENKLASLVDGSITEITASDLQGATSIRKSAFYEAPITSIEIPSSVTSMGNNAFRYCSNLTSVTIPNSVTTMGNYAFGDCVGLTSVVIGDNVTTINTGAFYNCRSLTSVVIPDSVTRIRSDALPIGSSSNKATITFLGTTPPTIYSDTFDTSRLQNIIVPKGYGDTYKSATNWSSLADYIIESET